MLLIIAFIIYAYFNSATYKYKKEFEFKLGLVPEIINSFHYFEDELTYLLHSGIDTDLIESVSTLNWDRDEDLIAETLNERQMEAIRYILFSKDIPINPKQIAFKSNINLYATTGDSGAYFGYYDGRYFISIEAYGDRVFTHREYHGSYDSGGTIYYKVLDDNYRITITDRKLLNDPHFNKNFREYYDEWMEDPCVNW